MNRDFTYIDDIINGILILLNNQPQKSEFIPLYRLENIGNGNPESLLDFIVAIENSIGIKAKKTFLEMQPGDVCQTWAVMKNLEKLGYKGTTIISKGVQTFITWYNSYYSRK